MVVTTGGATGGWYFCCVLFPKKVTGPVEGRENRPSSFWEKHSMYSVGREGTILPHKISGRSPRRTWHLDRKPGSHAAWPPSCSATLGRSLHFSEPLWLRDTSIPRCSEDPRQRGLGKLWEGTGLLSIMPSVHGDAVWPTGSLRLQRSWPPQLQRPVLEEPQNRVP